jgi:MFS family permease/lysophospholipase L1-like esterase
MEAATVTASADYVERSGHLLARSAFALAFLGTLAALIIAPFLLTEPMRPTARTGLMIAYGIVVLILIVLCGLLLRKTPEQLHAPAKRAAQLLSRRGVGISLGIVLVEMNLLAFFFITGITPNLTPLVVLFVIWSGLLLTIVFIANTAPLSAWLNKTRGLWAGTGLTLGLIAGFMLLYFLTSQILDRTNIVGKLRGAADYREITFFGGVVNPQQSSAYWEELGALQAQWLPYTYSRIEPHSGPFINVDKTGLRKTASFVPVDSTAPRAYFFGGSTVWGDGSRDDYTIPSQVARLLNDDKQPARVKNFGEVAYVSTQDLILFQTRLALGDVPEVAVFYGGFNDIASTYMHGVAGLPHNEVNRVQEFYAGRLMDAGQIILRRPNLSLNDVDLSLMTTPGGSAQETAERYLANVRLIRAVAKEYDVKVLFVWQPSILFKQSRTDAEESFVQQNEAAWPGYGKLYSETDTIVRKRISDGNMSDFLVLSDLFKDEKGYVFIDRVHVTEDGNHTIAQQIEPRIKELLYPG